MSLNDNEKISILIVDDHQVVRQGVKVFLDSQVDMLVIGEAESGEQAIKVCQDAAPDVVLLDLLMPGMDGVETTRRLKAISPRTQIVILTSYLDHEHVLPAMRAGAISYILKDISPTDLIATVRKAARGEAFLHSRVASQVVFSLQQETHQKKLFLDDLTERELEVLKLIAEGMSNADISQRLFISEKTVKSHVSNVLSKLQLADRTQIAVFAWREGFMKKAL